jgi:hypothetical protein
VSPWDVAQNKSLLQEALRDLLRHQPLDLEANEPGAGRSRRAKRHAWELGEQIQEQVGAAPGPLEARLFPIVDRLRGRGEAGGEGRVPGRGLEAPRVRPQLIAAVRVEADGSVRERNPTFVL